MPRESNNQDFLLGGQAVIEGVLMRSPNYYAVAVRKQNGDVVLRRSHQPNVTKRHRLLGLPFIRGIFLLGQTLMIGISALNFSAAVLSEEEDEKKEKSNVKAKAKGELSKWSVGLMLLLAFAFAFLLVVFLPLWLTDLMKILLPGLENPVLYNSVDGLFRVAVFLAYILLISLLPDIKRVFQYHGAEHMSVYASEAVGADEKVSVQKAREHSPYHPRCGTSFLLLVMMVAILVFSFTPTRESFWIKLLIRTPLIPVIAGISYELLKLTSKLRNGGLFAFLSAPGIWLQRLTARKPDDSQLEVAVLALNEVRDLERQFEGRPIPQEMEQSILAGST
ncbi:MAG TPA: DUF1385 domain-containing protein [Acidobacteriota bacterium]|nr:DUF1385 domain-containing protein [Acidobacteriota bacterium]